jgi:hypothetical protein
MALMVTKTVSLAHCEPNHRQQLAMERIEFAVGELATALLSSCQSRGAATVAIQDIRKSVARVISEILTAE